MTIEDNALFRYDSWSHCLGVLLLDLWSRWVLCSYFISLMFDCGLCSSAALESAKCESKCTALAHIYQLGEFARYNGKMFDKLMLILKENLLQLHLLQFLTLSKISNINVTNGHNFLIVSYTISEIHLRHLQKRKRYKLVAVEIISFHLCLARDPTQIHTTRVKLCFRLSSLFICT